MWETNHIVGNVAIESVDGATVQVRSRFHLMELRRDTVRHFGGSYRHTLVRDAGGALRIVLQRVDLFNGQAPFDYVLQIWV
jgi:benzoate/toluate 1,2-dioxygenase beta subunit